jgi:hypothetical protein
VPRPFDVEVKPKSGNEELKNRIRSKTMKFLCIYKPAKPEGTPPSQDEMTRMGKLIEDGFKSGWLLATEGCLPTALGARVRRSGGAITVKDGPFTEAKEIIGGFALIRTKSKEEAIELTRQFMDVAGDGESEIRQIYEMADATCVGNK